MRIDEKGRAILSAIQLNADDSLQIIAKLSKLPIHVVQYQLAKLRDLEIIRRGAVMNHARIGLQLHQVYLVGSTNFYKNLSAFKESLRNSSNVNWYAQLGGEFQLGLSIVSKNASEMARFFDSLSEQFIDPIKEKHFSIVLQHLVFRKRYLLLEKKLSTLEDYVTVSSDVPAIEIDQIDRSVLGAISDSTLLTNVEMAKKIGMARSTFEYRLEKLKEAKIIERSVFYINSRKLGYLTYRILIAVRGIRSVAFDRIKTFAKKDLSVTFLIYSVGTWDFEIVVEVLETSGVFDIVRKLHLENSDFIEHIQTLPIYEQSTSSAFLAN